MEQLIKDTLAALSGHRFDLTKEKKAQWAIDIVLTKKGVYYYREFDLSQQDHPDFFNETFGVVMEVKIKGSKMQIFKQCERYCQHERVNALIICTAKAMGFPPEINGKPCYYFDLGKAWL